MGLRRRSREKALQVMYSMEFNHKGSYDEALDDYYVYYNLPGNCPDADFDAEERVFVKYLLDEVASNVKVIESLIEKAAINWRMDRIAYIERNILRLSVAELLDDKNGIPFKATINEAIDIAKKFGNKESSSFVNGIINKVAEMIDVKQKKL